MLSSIALTGRAGDESFCIAEQMTTNEIIGVTIVCSVPAAQLRQRACQSLRLCHPVLIAPVELYCCRHRRPLSMTLNSADTEF